MKDLLHHDRHGGLRQALGIDIYVARVLNAGESVGAIYRNNEHGQYEFRVDRLFHGGTGCSGQTLQEVVSKCQEIGLTVESETK